MLEQMAPAAPDSPEGVSLVSEHDEQDVIPESPDELSGVLGESPEPVPPQAVAPIQPEEQTSGRLPVIRDTPLMHDVGSGTNAFADLPAEPCVEFGLPETLRFDFGYLDFQAGLGPDLGRSGLTDKDSALGTDSVFDYEDRVADGHSVIVSVEAHGREDTPVSIDIRVNMEDKDGSETMSIVISDLPEGATLNHGTDNGDGSWTLTLEDLQGLTLTPPEFSDQDFTINIEVTSTESLSGDSRTTVHPVHVIIDAVADAPALTVEEASGPEDSAIALEIRAELADTDGSETLTFVISGVPAGSVLSAGTDNGDGTWSLTPADLPGLTITPPTDLEADFDILVTATATESSNGDTASTTLPLHVDVLGVNDAPVAADIDLGQIQEDQSLDFTSATLLAGASDADGDTLAVTAVSADPAHGTITDNGDGTWTFTPIDNLTGEMSLGFIIDDGHGGTDQGMASLEILPVNDAPLVIGDVRLGTINEDTSVTFSEDLLLADIIDPEGDEISVTSVTADPALGTVTDNGDGTWTFTPTDNYHGPADISFTVADSHGASSAARATVDILPINDPPASGGVTDLGQCPEDSSLTFSSEDLLSGVHDADDDTLTVISVTVDPSQGTVTDNGDGTWTFNPAEDFNGEANIIADVNDGNGGTGTTVAAVDVTAVNDAPVAGNVDLGQTGMDTAVTFTREQLLANSSDVDGDALTAGLVDVNPAFGAITDNGDGTWTYTPAAGFTGDDVEISFTVSDGNGGLATARALVDVTSGANLPPVAGNVDLGAMAEDGSMVFSASQLLAGSSDPDGDALSVTAVTVNPAYGSVADNGDGTWTFTPSENFHDFDVPLIFAVDDGNGGTDTAVALVDIIPSADIPVAGDVDLGQIDEDHALTFSAERLLANTTEADGDPLSVTSVTVNPTYGDIVDNGDGTWTFVPSENFHGEDIFLCFAVEDQDGRSTAAASLDVIPVNDPPQAGDVDLGQCQAGDARIITVYDLLANSFDIEGDALNVSEASVYVNPAYGEIQFLGGGNWNFTPTEGFTGENVPIRFMVSDGELETAAVALIDVVDDPSGNRPPVTGTVFLGSTGEDTPMTFDASDLLLATVDPDGDPLTVTAVGVNPAFGSVADNGDGTWTFTPTENFHGSNVPLTYTVIDGRGGFSIGTGVVDVLAANDAPAAGNVDLGQIREDQSMTVTEDLLLTDSVDPDGDRLSVTAVTIDPALGTVTDNGDGTWTFNPAADVNGNDIPLTFTVSDGNGGITTAQATVDVIPVNDAPVVIAMDLGQTMEDTPLTFAATSLLAGSSDVDGDTLSVSAVTVDPAHGTVTDNGDGTWAFTPTENFNGNDVALNFTVSDGNGGTASRQATVDVIPVNDAPVATDVDLGQTQEDAPLTFDAATLLAGSTDIDGDTLGISAVTVDPAFGTVTDNGDGTWTFNPTENFNGNDIALNFTVSDGHGGTATAQATVDVTPANDAPVATDIDIGQTQEETPLTFDAAALLAGATDIDGDTLSVTAITVDPAFGTVTNNGDGTWTFNPTENFNGNDVALNFTVSDGHGGITTAQGTVDVVPVNDAPVASAVDLGQTQEDTPLTFAAATLLAGASDIDGDTLSVTAVTIDPTHGTITNNGDGTWTFNPTENFNGNDIALNFTVSDGNGGTATAQATVDVTPANDAPVATDIDLGQTQEDTPLTFDAAALLAGASDIDGDDLSVTAVTINPAFGTVTDNGDGTWTFSPSENFNGNDIALNFTVSDGNGGTATAQATVDVTPANDAPVATDIDLGQTQEDTPLTFDAAALLAGASDIDGDDLSVTAVTINPAFGTVTDNGDGTWTFSPSENFNGNDIALNFTVSDGNGGTATAQATVDVTPANDAPVATDIDLGQTQEDTPLTFDAAALLAGASDIDGDTLSVTAVSVDPAHGTVTDNGDGTWTFNPNENFNGNDIALNFTVSDGNGGTATAQATVDVTPANDAPVATDIDLGQTQEDTPLTFDAAALLAGASDIDGDTLSVTAVSVDPAHGTVTDNGDGTWTFTPTENFNGNDLPLTFTVSDGNGATATAQATVDVIPVNDAPVVIGDVLLGTINEDTSVTFSENLLLADITDPEGDALTIVSVSADPAQGTVTDNGDGTWTFTPVQDFNGTAAISFTVSDPHGASSAAQATVDILPVNDPPTSGGVTELGQCPEDSSLTFSSEDLLSGVHDADGDPLTVISVTVDPSQGTVTDNGDGTWTFTPAENVSGDANINYTVDDGNGGTGTAAAVVDVIAANDAPVAGDVDLGQTYMDTALTFPAAQLLANTYDPDGDALALVSVTVDPAMGTITDNGDGTWTFTPAAGFTGDDTAMTFTVSDGNGGTASAQALVDITSGANHPPLAGSVDLGAMQEDGSLTFMAHQLLAGSSDPDGDALSIASVSVNPHFGAVTDNGDGTWTFTPAENFNGDDTALTFTVNDGNGGTASAVALVDVTAAADLPVAGDVDLGNIDEDHSLTFSAERLLANTSEADGDPLNVTAVGVNPAFGAITDNGDGTWTFTPAQDFHGPVSIAFTVADADGQSSAVGALDVLTVNDAPQAGDVDLGQWQAGTARFISIYELLANSFDVEGDTLDVPEASVRVNPAYGEIQSLGGGYWYFIPAAGFTGENVPIHFMVNDGELETAAVALIDVVDDPSGNQPPATAAVYLGATNEDSPFMIFATDLLLSTIDPDGDPLDVTSLSVHPAYGSLTFLGDGAWRFTPAENYHGTSVPVVFTADDGRGGTSTGVGLIDVLPVNDAPTAGSVDLGQIQEDHALTFTRAQLLANSYDVDGDVLSVGAVNVDPSLGTVTDNGDGTWTFEPTPDYNGAVSIAFTVTDDSGSSTSTTAALDVLPVNDPPVTGDVDLATINENTSVTFSRHMLLSNAADFDGDPFDVSGLHVLPDQGALAENPDGTWTFTPTEDFQGTAAITFTVTDASGDTATALAMVDVLSVNAPPAAHDALYLGQILEDPSEPLTFTTEDLLSVVHDPEGDPLAIASVSVSKAQGSLTHDAATDTWAFTPAKDFNGKVNIDYTFTDDSGGTGSGSAVVDVLPVDDLPVARPLIASYEYYGFGEQEIYELGEVRAETPTTFSEAFLESFFHHPDGKPLTVIDVSVAPAHGTFTDNGDGTWTFTSTATAPDSLPVTITAIDDDGHTVTAAIPIEIEWDATNLAAVVGDVDLGAIQEDGSLTITWYDLMDNTYDPEGDPLYPGFWVGVNPAYGTVVNNVDRIEDGHHYYNTWTFIPAENFHGDNVPLIFTVSDRRYDDGVGTYVGGTAIVDVLSVTDVGNVDLGPILEDHSFTFTEAQLLANCEDEGDTPSIASVSVDPAQGELTDNGDGTWTFTPVENFHGDAKISFTVAYTDEQISAEANLTVIPVNDAPLAVDVDLGQSPDGALYFTAAELLANSSDVEGEALSVIAGSVTVHPYFGQIIEMGPESWMYLAPEGFSYEDVPISFRVSDGDLEVTATALIDVDTHSSNVPLVQTLSLAPSLTVTLDTVADPDGDQLTITHVTGDAGDTLEIADQANWRHEDSDADHHHLVSTAGSAELYVDRDVDIHVVGGVDATDGSTPINDSLHVDDFFHTVLSGGGDDTITIDPILFHQDGIIDAADFTCIDGGNGFDVLKFGIDQALLTGTEMDLTALNAHQVENIEAIDITGNTGQDNSLTLDAASVIDVTDANNALHVQGDAGDTVHVSDAASWTHAGTSDMGGVTYEHYTGLDAFGTVADLYVQHELMINLSHP